MATDPADISRRIGKLDIGERAFTVEWADGHESVFHYVWLRLIVPAKSVVTGIQVLARC